MDIIQTRQEERKKKLIKLTMRLGKLLDKGKTINKKESIIWAMSELDVARRTACEYVDVVMMRLS